MSRIDEKLYQAVVVINQICTQALNDTILTPRNVKDIVRASKELEELLKKKYPNIVDTR